MTTIAYKDGILAADSRLVMGDVKMLSSDKIKVLNRDTIFAGAGDSATIILAEQFFSQADWEGKLGARPELPKNKDGEVEVEGILVSKGRVYLVDDKLVPDLLAHPFCALGSGWKFAMAAMHTGMSAADAVAFASEFDVYTNDKVKFLNVEEFFKKKKSRGTKGTPPVETTEAQGGGGAIQGSGGGRSGSNE